MSLEVVRYDFSLKAQWDALLDEAGGGVFLFKRDYMDYHSDRFTDCSAMVFLDGNPVAVLPAALAEGGDHVISHSGLTFGGLVMSPTLRTETIQKVVQALLDEYKRWGIAKLTIRAVPAIFRANLDGAIDYALFERGFRTVGRALASVIDLSIPSQASRSRVRDISRAKKLGVQVREAGLSDFYPLLEEVLAERHGTKPVHSLEELARLSAVFPERFLIRCALHEEAIVAGAFIFKYDRVWHAQYLAASSPGRRIAALDSVIVAVADEARAAGVPFFSLGTSMDGPQINYGLLWQKESFGAKAVLFDRLEGYL